jgi:hypothetical protein
MSRYSVSAGFNKSLSFFRIPSGFFGAKFFGNPHPGKPASTSRANVGNSEDVYLRDLAEMVEKS